MTEASNAGANAVILSRSGKHCAAVATAELFGLPPPDLACYAYVMVNRQDIPYSHRSPKLGRGPLSAEIIFDGTKLALAAEPSKTTTNGMICCFQLYSINRKIRIVLVAV
ncbi:hypothetical protein [Candidatus Binatus sp.]|uniref:hypothetical protein n=1 Tax=Candidatus Binatus sp. TaxID=2811406 RepID=UPI002F9221AD